MATTIDIPCPKCGEPVMGEPLKGSFHDLMFFKFMRSSFRVECTCDFKKTYRFVSAEALAKMYEAAPSGEKPIQPLGPTRGNGK